MKIFINPGYGGADCGAVGNGLKESEVALKIGKRIYLFQFTVTLQNPILPRELKLSATGAQTKVKN